MADRLEPRPRIEAILSKVTAELTQTFGGRLVSLIHFGATLEQSPDEPPMAGRRVRLALVLPSVDEVALRKLTDLLRTGPEFRETDCLLFSREEVETTADVFPSLFIEMKQRKVLLAGEDIFQSLAIREHHLRLRCEQQFKSLALSLQAAFVRRLPEGSSFAHLRSGFDEFTVALRGTLWLLDVDPPTNERDLLIEAERQLSYDEGKLSELRQRIYSPPESAEDKSQVWIELIALVRHAAQFVDRFADDVIIFGEEE